MTFDPFGDYAVRGYLRNHHGLPRGDDLARLEFNNFRSVLPDLLSWLEDQPVNYDTLLRLHEKMFANIYPWAGEDRSTTAPDIAITRGGEDQIFCHPVGCRLAADHALRLAEGDGILRQPGAVYSALCHSHPFLDGNGRTLLLFHSELMRRQNAHIRWEEIAETEFLRVLTDDLNSPDAGIMDRLLMPKVERSSRSRTDLEVMMIDEMQLHGRLETS